MPDVSTPARDIFLAALERATPRERAEYVRAACGDDARLQQHVEALLRVHDEPDSLLDQSRINLHARPDGISDGIDVTLPTLDQPSKYLGTSIGPYKLVEQIGEGGMGLVFMAEQQRPVRRLVALKVVKPGMDSRQVIARFEAERQALAMMDHPNIARVLDAGATDAGHPYFVMELVRGIPLNEFCDQKRLTVRQRLELFIQVCQAMQHAHQKGVIHRDLKPTNVLVTMHDALAVPKVIDFGIAKALGQQLTDHTLITGFAQLIGTPLYMSPEQADMNQFGVDTRSDIYSLGVLLYELLTGTTPFDKQTLTKAGFDELRRVLREVEPPRPSACVSTLRAEELSTMAQRRGVDDRRLNRLLRGELDWIVMKALEKDRNRRYESCSALAADVQHYLNDEQVQAGPPSAAYRMQKFARRNKGKLVITGILSLLVCALTTSIGWTLRDQVSRQTITEQLAVEALRDAQPHQDRGEWPLALAAVDRAHSLVIRGPASDELKQQVWERLRDLRMVIRLEEIRLEKSSVKDGNFDLAGAEKDYADAFRDYGIDVLTLAPNDAASQIRDGSIRIQLAAALDDWALSVFCCDKDRFMKLLSISRLADPDEWRNRFREVTMSGDLRGLIELAASAPIERLPTQTLSLAGKGLRDSAKYDEAINLLRKAQQKHPGDFWINHALAESLASTDPPQYDAAVQFFTAAIALRPLSPGARHNLGNVLRKKGSVDDALASYREAIRLKPNYAEAHTNLGGVLLKIGSLDEALVCFQEAVRLKPDDAKNQRNLGIALEEKGLIDEALARIREAIRLRPDFADAHCSLGIALYRKGSPNEALPSLREAIRLKRDHAGAHSSLGGVLCDIGLLDEALPSLREAIRLEPDSAIAWYNLGNVQYGKRSFDEAVASYSEAIRHKPDYAEAHSNMGNALITKGLLDEGISCGREAVRLKPDDAKNQHNLGVALLNRGLIDEALPRFNEAIRLKPDYVDAHHGRGLALEGTGKFTEALTTFRRVHELGSRTQGWRRPSAEWVKRSETLVTLDAKLAAVLGGAEQPASEAERVQLASFCLVHKHLNVPAARMYRQALEAQPRLAEDLRAGHRYNAACAAAMAASGTGADADKVEDVERAEWRGQALVWLRADLALWNKLLEQNTPQARAVVHKKLQHWQQDKDLTGMRDDAALAKLPEAEQAEWRTLWADVAALLAKVSAAAAPQPASPTPNANPSEPAK